MKKTLIPILLFIGCIVALALPFVLRNAETGTFFYGSETSYTQRLIVHYTGYDALQQRTVPFNLFYTLLSFISFDQILLTWLPVLLGLITFTFFFLMVRKSDYGYIMLLLLITSPLFTTLFTTLQPYTFALTLSIIGLYIFVEKKSWIALLFFGVTPLIDVFFGFFVLTTLVVFCLFRREYLKLLFLVLIAMIVPSIYMVSTNTITSQGYFVVPNVNTFFIELGAFPGVSITLMILGMLGISFVWKSAKDRFFAYLLFIGFFLLALISSIYFILFAIALPFFAAYAIRYFWDRKWTFSILKNITYFLIVCSLVFPAIIAYDNIVKQQPTAEMEKALKFLGQKYDGNGVILTKPEYGFLVQQYAHCPTYLDTLTTQYPFADQKYAYFDNLLHSRDLTNTTQLLEQENITYIVVDQSMRESYWNNQEEGLLFLMKYNGEFTHIYNKDKIDIFTFAPTNST